MKYIFVDFEMEKIDAIHRDERSVCVQEIIEIGAVMLDEDHQEISSFKAYVKPQYSEHVSKIITELTGITDQYLWGCRGIADEMEAFAEWCTSLDDEIEVYSWSFSDLNQIENEYRFKGIEYSDKLKLIVSNWIDLQAEFGKAVGVARQTSLERALESMGLLFSGHMHDALDDSRNTAAIFKELSNSADLKAANRFLTTYVCETSKGGTTLGDLLDFSRFKVSA